MSWIVAFKTKTGAIEQSIFADWNELINCCTKEYNCEWSWNSSVACISKYVDPFNLYEVDMDEEIENLNKSCRAEAQYREDVRTMPGRL